MYYYYFKGDYLYDDDDDDDPPPHVFSIAEVTPTIVASPIFANTPEIFTCSLSSQQ